MRRIATIALAAGLLPLVVGACGPSLSDAEWLWCQSNRLEVQYTSVVLDIEPWWYNDERMQNLRSDGGLRQGVQGNIRRPMKPNRPLESAGSWLATADLAEDRPDVGSGDTQREAVRDALSALGEPYATEMAEAAELDDAEVGRP